MLTARRHPTMKHALRNESGVFGTYALAVVATVSAAVVAVLLLGATRSGGSEPWLALFEAEAGPVWLAGGVPKYERDIARIALPQPTSDVVAASGDTSVHPTSGTTAFRDYDAAAEQIPPSF